MKKFTLIWLGQFLSIMGSSMTRFAFLIWAYDQTGKASTTALLGFFAYLPFIIISPFAGVLIDKWDRKKIMILSDLSSGMLTILLLISFLTNHMLLWFLFIFEGISSALEAFQIPAYRASITLLIPKDKYAKASGMRSLSTNASQIAAPILTGALLGIIGISGIMMIDIATFLFAVITLLFVRIPKVIKKVEKTTFMRDIKCSLNYLHQRKGLFYLMLVFGFINLLAATTYFGVLPAYILASTNKNEIIYGMVQTTLGIGGVIGSIVVSIVGVPKKKITTMIIAGITSFLLGDIFIGISRNEILWMIAAFLSSLPLPFLIGAENALWQSKVEPNIQGRIFSLKAMITTSMMPLGFILGGYLADYVFEPMFVHHKNLFTFLVGQEKGAGMGFMFILSGILGSMTCLMIYLIKPIRRIETDLPDFDQIN